jgi:RNA polymerase sigma factor for flagellar operon FliA
MDGTVTNETDIRNMDGAAQRALMRAATQTLNECEGLPTAAESARLTAEQERMLIEHLPIVRSVARQIYRRLPQHIDIDDMVSDGSIGLMDACARFDPAKCVPFPSYAKLRIRGAILDSLRDLDWGPRQLRQKSRRIDVAVSALRARLGRTPNETEVAQEMGLQIAQYHKLLDQLNGLEIESLHVARHEDSSEDRLTSLPARSEESPFFLYQRGEIQRRMIDAISQLPDRERQVMTLYYYQDMTMPKIGMALGVGAARVSQIHSAAVAHLKAALRAPAAHGTSGPIPSWKLQGGAGSANSVAREQKLRRKRKLLSKIKPSGLQAHQTPPLSFSGHRRAQGRVDRSADVANAPGLRMDRCTAATRTHGFGDCKVRARGSEHGVEPAETGWPIGACSARC